MVYQKEFKVGKETWTVTVKENTVNLYTDRFYDVGGFRCSLDDCENLVNILVELVNKAKEN